MTFDLLQLALIVVVVIDIVIIFAIVLARLAARRDAPAWPADIAGGAAHMTQAPEDPPAAPGSVVMDTERPWADPATVSDEPAQWRRVLSREAARAARYGRPATIMQVELDQDVAAARPEPADSQAEGLLLGIISSRVRSSDYVSRTAPGRFHLILTDMPEAEAAAVAERIRAEFSEHAPDGPPMLVGWAGTPPQDGLTSSLWRAAEQVHADRRRLRAGEGSGAVSPGAPETALAALERVRGLGLVSEDEYRAKRSEILARL